MRTIKELLDGKAQRDVFTIDPEATVFEAVTHMVERNIGAVLVEHGGVIQGIMTERDYLRFITVKGRTARDTPVADLMTRRVIFITPDATLDDAMAIMTQNRIRHIPVLTEGRLVGIVSIGDLVKQIGRNQEVKIQVLEEYIADRYPGPKKQQDKNRKETS